MTIARTRPVAVVSYRRRPVRLRRVHTIDPWPICSSVRRRGRRSGAHLAGGIPSVDAAHHGPRRIALPAGVVVVDEDDVVTLVNSAAERLGIDSGRPRRRRAATDRLAGPQHR